METKTLPAFRHSSIGSKTHKARTATAHVSYIMRSDAMTKFQAENMPHGGRGTRVFFDNLWEKAGSPEKARIADKFMIALPIFLNDRQRVDVLATFMNGLGQGRIAWCAAHHDAGKDAHNPHAHIIFKDADITTGRKIIGTTTSSHDVREARENGWKIPPRMTTAQLREAWCNHLNRFLEREGIAIRYDHRSYKQRGIEKRPGIHIGPKAQALAEQGFDLKSHDLTRRSQIGQQSIPYSQLDEGNRADHNAKITEANRERERQQITDQASHEQTKGHDQDSFQRMMAEQLPKRREDQEKLELRETQAEARKTLQAEQTADREALRHRHLAESKVHDRWAKQLYAKARDAAHKATKEHHTEKWKAVNAIQIRADREKAEAALKIEQSVHRLHESDRRIQEARPVKDKAWKEMKATQDKERLDLRASHRLELAALARQQIAEQAALHEKWRAYALDRQSNRLESRLTNRQGMAQQQTAAIATIKFRNRANVMKSPDGFVAVPASPHEAARFYLANANSEFDNAASLRRILTQRREDNIRSAPEIPPYERNLGGRPRRNGAAPPQDQRADLRQAVASGRSLTDAERTAADLQLKLQIDGKEYKQAELREFPLVQLPQNERGKGRPGGGRGR